MLSRGYPIVLLHVRPPGTQEENALVFFMGGEEEGSSGDWHAFITETLYSSYRSDGDSSRHGGEFSLAARTNMGTQIHGSKSRTRAATFSSNLETSDEAVDGVCISFTIRGQAYGESSVLLASLSVLAD